jgi:hypothetical protein
MSTEHQPNADAQAEHAELFRRIAAHLAAQVGQLVSLAGEPKLRPVDVGMLYLATAVNVLVLELGDTEVATRLRTLADALEAGDTAMVRN